jgi:N-acetylmuramoyl-L-alanine amidase
LYWKGDRRVIMLIGDDAGHGGKDPGAAGLNGLKEKDVNLAIAQSVYYALVSAGLECYMTRKTDESMELLTRTTCINNMGCDYAVSIHCNASDHRDADYIATYIQGTGGKAEQLARKVQAQLVAATSWEDGGVKVANLHMTRETRMPAILVECGFISNPEQEAQLATPAMQRTIAVAIARGILEYIGVGEAKRMAVTTVSEALKVLQAKNVISDSTYWAKVVETTKFVDALLINMANKIQEVS